MTQPQPTVTITQPKIAFILSVLALSAAVYSATDWFVRREIEIDELKKSYIQLSEGQESLKQEIKSLRETVDGEIRHMTSAMNRLVDTLEESE